MVSRFFSLGFLNVSFMTLDKNRFNKIQIKTMFLFKIKEEFFRIFFGKKTNFFLLVYAKPPFFLNFQGPSGIVLQERSLYVVDSKGKYLHQYAVTEKWRKRNWIYLWDKRRWCCNYYIRGICNNRKQFFYEASDICFYFLIWKEGNLPNKAWEFV